MTYAMMHLMLPNPPPFGTQRDAGGTHPTGLLSCLICVYFSKMTADIVHRGSLHPSTSTKIYPSYTEDRERITKFVFVQGLFCCQW